MNKRRRTRWYADAIFSFTNTAFLRSLGVIVLFLCVTNTTLAASQIKFPNAGVSRVTVAAKNHLNVPAEKTSADRVQVSGKVTELNTKNFVVQTHAKDNPKVTVTFDRSTQFFGVANFLKLVEANSKDHSKIKNLKTTTAFKISDLSVGEDVSVSGIKNSDGSVRALIVNPVATRASQARVFGARKTNDSKVKKP